MNRRVQNFNINQFEEPLKFNSQEDILEAHQLMINQLRDNVLKLANRTQIQDKLIGTLIQKIEKLEGTNE